jgi:predicted GNAT family acetyltransferase
VITHVPERRRFEQEENGHLVIADYRLKDGVHALMHIEAEPELRGTGAADRFMAALSDYARVQKMTLAPYCSYARAWFKRHPQAADVLEARLIPE